MGGHNTYFPYSFMCFSALAAEDTQKTQNITEIGKGTKGASFCVTLYSTDQNKKWRSSIYKYLHDFKSTN